MSRKLGAGGFTLVELLTVVSIISILAGVIFPTIISAKEKGKQAACLSNLRQLASAMLMYAEDNDGRLPLSAQTQATFGMQDWCGCPEPSSPDVDPSKGSIWRYTAKSLGIFICVSDRGVPAERVTGQPKDYPLSYAMNSSLSMQRPDAISGAWRISRVMLLIHQGRDSIDNGDFNPNSADVPKSIHGNGTTLVYADGHVRWANYGAMIQEISDGSWNPQLSR